MTILHVSSCIYPYNKVMQGLVLQCIDRMLRPPCIDVGAGAIIHDDKLHAAARRAPSEKHAGWWEFLAVNLRKAKELQNA